MKRETSFTGLQQSISKASNPCINDQNENCMDLNCDLCELIGSSIAEVNTNLLAILDAINNPTTEVVQHNIVRKLLTASSPVADKKIPQGAIHFNIIPSSINIDTSSPNFGQSLSIAELKNRVKDVQGNWSPLVGVSSFNSNDDRTSNNKTSLLPVDIEIDVTGFVIIEYTLP